MKGRIVVIANQKGGVGKTTTAINLAACLAAAEQKTLLIDIDPQANACSGIGFRRNGGGVSNQDNIYYTLIGKKKIKDVVAKTNIKWLSIVPSDISLIGAEIELVSVIARETRLKEALTEIKEEFDYIIVDCPPSLGLLTINSLTAADSVLIPVQCEYYALEGISQLINTVNLVKRSLNTNLALEGILLTMYDKRTNLSIQVEEEVKKHFKQKVFKTIIPRNIKLSEAPSHGKPIIMYDIRSKGSEAYLQLAKEVILNGKKSLG
ncbi:MAG: AAA family ATPase [bacterium]